MLVGDHDVDGFIVDDFQPLETGLAKEFAKRRVVHGAFEPIEHGGFVIDEKDAL